jgi:tetratricopeptide (TPR) repeat protein
MTGVFDLHDRAYSAWRDAAVRREVLVHVDAHHDAALAEPWAVIDIGNYVRAAIRDGMLAAIRWIVPDPVWSDLASRAILLGELRHIGSGPVDEEPSGARATVDGVEMWMGPLAGLPLPVSRVLLDIDIDYFVTARYEDGQSAEPLTLPWCWPRDLGPRLRAAGLQPLITTIATSVTGGFTPLKWAHLGREMAARLDGTASTAMLACFAALEQAARLRAGGDEPAALEACRGAASLCPAEPAAYFHLAEMLQGAGRLDEARAVYRRATELDPSYCHPFRSRGPYLCRRKRLLDAEAAYREALALDPDDPGAQAGLAMVAFALGRPADACDLAERSLAADPGSVDAWRALAAARAQLGRPAAAIEAYEHAMALSLHGATPLGGPWSSNPDRRLVDPRHWHDHAAVADLHAGLGAVDAATAHNRIAAAGGLGRTFGRVLPS